MHFIKDNGYGLARGEVVTPREVHAQRRSFLGRLAAGAAGTTLAAWGARDAMAQTAAPGKLRPLPGAKSAVVGAMPRLWKIVADTSSGVTGSVAGPMFWSMIERPACFFANVVSGIRLETVAEIHHS